MRFSHGLVLDEVSYAWLGPQILSQSHWILCLWPWQECWEPGTCRAGCREGLFDRSTFLSFLDFIFINALFWEVPCPRPWLWFYELTLSESGQQPNCVFILLPQTMMLRIHLFLPTIVGVSQALCWFSRTWNFGFNPHALDAPSPQLEKPSIVAQRQPVGVENFDA